MTIFIKIIGVLVYLSLASCGNEKEGQKVTEGKDLWNKLEEANKILAEYEREEILDFISRRGWKMEETGSGLWIEVYETAKGQKASFGNKVALNYTVMLLNGEIIYSSAERGKKVFLVGRGGVEAGLEEAILLLGSGDKARIIMPPHLAHGFHGDGERVPRRATIVYDLEVSGVE